MKANPHEPLEHAPCPAGIGLVFLAASTQTGLPSHLHDWLENHAGVFMHVRK
jgi:hypothetical protein